MRKKGGSPSRRSGRPRVRRPLTSARPSSAARVGIRETTRSWTRLLRIERIRDARTATILCSSGNSPKRPSRRSNAWREWRETGTLTPETDDSKPASRCIWCGYIVDHLPENRCPECGNAFDPDDPGNVVVGETRVGLLDVLRLLARGVPLSSHLSRIEWAGLTTPVFPFAFVACASVAAATANTVWAACYASRYRIVAGEVLDSFAWHLFVNGTFSALGILWIYAVVGVMLKGTGASKRLAKRGAARVTYFSAALLPFTKTSNAILAYYSSDWPKDIRDGAFYCLRGYPVDASTYNM